MKHKLKISVSKQPQTGGIVTCRNLTVRERLLRFLLGDKRRVTVLIPGDSVGEIAICETKEGGSTWTVPVEELKTWAENVLKPKAQMAYNGEGEYLPGEWCTFCRAAVRCRARAEEKLKLAQSEFRLPPLLTDAEIEEILSVLPDLTRWANEITAYATDAAVNHGKEWNGFKVVEGRSVRKYRDEEKVAEAATEAGYKDIYRKSLITLTEMQKLMGKAKFEEVLGGLIYKPLGKPTLVPNTDKRPAMNVTNAINEFNEIKEEM